MFYDNELEQLILVLNEIAYLLRFSNNNIKTIIYWISWIHELEHKSKNLNLNFRKIKDVNQKLTNLWEWILWNIILNEVYYRNRYGRTVLQQISLNFNEDTYKFYPDYFKEFIEENILDKYNLIQAKSNIKNDRDFGIVVPKPGDFGLYTKKLVRFRIEDGIEKKYYKN